MEINRHDGMYIVISIIIGIVAFIVGAQTSIDKETISDGVLYGYVIGAVVFMLLFAALVCWISVKIRDDIFNKILWKWLTLILIFGILIITFFVFSS